MDDKVLTERAVAKLRKLQDEEVTKMMNFLILLGLRNRERSKRGLILRPERES